jgi:hypothetical protein
MPIYNMLFYNELYLKLMRGGLDFFKNRLEFLKLAVEKFTPHVSSPPLGLSLPISFHGRAGREGKRG